MARKSRAAQVYLSVPCPMCGSAKGQPCESTSARGGMRILPASASHKARMRAAWGKPELNTGESPNHTVTTPVTSSDREELDAHVEREDRIQKVIWGIHFARTVMHKSQGELDRRLAEMIVDAGTFDIL